MEKSNNSTSGIHVGMQRVIVLGILLVCALSTNAQKTYIGVKGGGHISSSFIEHTVFNVNLNAGLLPGSSGGVFVRFLPKKNPTFLNSGIQLGVNYVQKGWTQSFLTGRESYTSRLDYLEVPLEGIGYFGNKNKYFVSVGFLMEFLANTNQDEEPTEDDLFGVDFYTYREDRDRTFGYGGRVAGGIFRDFSFGTVQVEGFFSYTFSNFIEPGDLTTGLPDISNHWVFGATVSYMIQVGGKKDE